MASGDTTSPPSATALNARSRTIVEALVKGDIAPLRAALGPGGPDSAEMTQQEHQLMEGRRERFGTFQSIDVLGTVPGPEGRLQTTVRLNFERGGATNIYTWDRDGRIMDLGARPYSPVELMPSARGELRAFDARTGGGARFTVGADGLTALTARGSLLFPRGR